MTTTSKIATTTRALMAVLSVLVTSAGYAATHNAGCDLQNGLFLEANGPVADHATPSLSRPPRWPRREI